MTDHEAKAKELLPCRTLCGQTYVYGFRREHEQGCPYRFRPAVAAALAEVWSAGYKASDDEPISDEQFGRLLAKGATVNLHTELAQLRAEVEKWHSRAQGQGDIADNLGMEVQELRAELERERMRLAACGVAALSNTEKSIKEQRIDKDNPYFSASYQDVCNAVDREMQLRAKLAPMQEPLVTLCSWCGPNVKTDEDGCCSACGGTAIGEGVDKISRELKALKAERDAAYVKLEQFAKDYPCHCAENYPGTRMHHGHDCQNEVVQEFVAQFIDKAKA